MKVRLTSVRLLAGVAAAAVISLAAYSTMASGAPAAKIQIAVLGYNASPYGIASKLGAEAEAKKLGASVTWFNANNDPHAQSVQLQDAITTGKYQGMWIWALDGHGLSPVIKQAVKKGIKVAVADYTLGTLQEQVTLKPTAGLVSTIGSSIGAQVKGFIAEIKKACTTKVGAGKTCNVAFLPGLANYPTDVYRIGVMKKAFSSGPVKFSLMPPGLYDQPTSQKVTLDYFQTKPKVDVLASFGDQMTAGSVVAFKQLGIKPGKDVLVMGSGATTESIAWIKSGLWFASIALYPTAESHLGIRALVDAINGKKVPTTINVLKQPGLSLIIDADFLKTHPKFKGDWSLS